MKKSREEYKAIIEALLFTWGDPLSLNDIGEVVELKGKILKEILEDLIDDYKDKDRGLFVEKIKDTYRLATKESCYPYIKKLNKPIGSKSLSNAALETLSIIAYKQPVIKSEIESIRGVKCDTAIYTLLDKELIEEKGRLDRIGRPILYGTTDEFLRVFGLESIDKLPELGDFFQVSEDDSEESMEG